MHVQLQSFFFAFLLSKRGGGWTAEILKVIRRKGKRKGPERNFHRVFPQDAPPFFVAASRLVLKAAWRLSNDISLMLHKDFVCCIVKCLYDEVRCLAPFPSRVTPIPTGFHYFKMSWTFGKIKKLNKKGKKRELIIWNWHKSWCIIKI